MVNVLDEVLPLLDFENPDEFYYLQIIQRRKDNPDMGGNSRVIKNYYIFTQEYLLKYFPEMQELCKVFNARAMLRLNKRHSNKVALKTLCNISNTLSTGDPAFARKAYNRACGQGHSYAEKSWIIDIDAPWDNWVSELREIIDKAAPEGEKLITLLPTKSGFHLITWPFDLRELRREYPGVDIHKDNPINLYIP